MELQRNLCKISWSGRCSTLRVRYVYYWAWAVAYSTVRDASSNAWYVILVYAMLLWYPVCYSSLRYLTLVYGILL